MSKKDEPQSAFDANSAAVNAWRHPMAPAPEAPAPTAEDAPAETPAAETPAAPSVPRRTTSK